MSLFRVKEKWSVDIGVNEEFHEGSLCVDVFDGNEVKIIVGSLTGVLRVYEPHLRSFRLEDQLLVTDLQHPILQLASGFFTSYSTPHTCPTHTSVVFRHGTKTLAVLHSMSLAILSVQTTPDGVNCTSLYCYTFRHTAANMACGAFTNKRGRSSVVVQSLDGELTFVEEDCCSSVLAFQHHLIAGPVVYFDERDALVTSTSAFEIVAYSYQSLKTKATVSHQELELSVAASVAINNQEPCLWKLVIGEVALSITKGYLTAPSTGGGNHFAIVVLGEKSLFYVSFEGALLSQKRLEVAPLTILAYPVPSSQPPPKQSKVLISTQSGSLMVFDQTKLMWSAKCETIPVALRIAKLQNVEGMIIGLDDKGHLSCCFLGTTPTSSLPFLSDESALGQEEITQQYKLLKKQLQNERFQEESDIMPSPLDFNFEIQEDDQCLKREGEESEHRQFNLKIIFHVFCQSSEAVLNCDFLFGPPRSVHIDEDSWTVPVIDPGEDNKISIPLRFSRARGLISGNKTCSIVASYTDQNQCKRVNQWSIELPLSFFYKAVPPVKEAKHKFVLETNQGAVSLREIFGDVLEHSGFQHVLESSVLTLESSSTSRVTIIVSKSAGRYRVQSDSLESMPLLVSELETRLRLHYNNSQANKEICNLNIRYKDSLPLEEYFRVVQDHSFAREELMEMEKQLEKQTLLYRATQKRLITKYKDPKPGSIEPLCFLLQNTLEKIISLSEGVDARMSRFDTICVKLSLTTELVVLLFQLQTDLSSVEKETLTNMLRHDGTLDTEIAWEECSKENIQYAFASYLGSEKSGQIPGSCITKTSDITTLQEDIAELFHQIKKRGHLIPKPNPEKSKSARRKRS